MGVSLSLQAQQAAKEHPLAPVIRWAETSKVVAEQVKDYTAILYKQENIDGKVQEEQVLDLKIRHRPFSVYLKFREPKKMSGQEAIWIPSRNDGKLVAHGVGFEKHLGTQQLDPESYIAMRGCKYSIKEVGILRLLNTFLEVGKKDAKHGECNVTYTESVKISGRDCRLIQITHPTKRDYFIFHLARVYVDKELNLPIRYESYGWPSKPGEQPILLERYTYAGLKLNVGLVDMDFNQKNLNYGYSK
jgi:hypothetical protein